MVSNTTPGMVPSTSALSGMKHGCVLGYRKSKGCSLHMQAHSSGPLHTTQQSCARQVWPWYLAGCCLQAPAVEVAGAVVGVGWGC